MTRYRKCSAKDLQNRIQFINRHLETLNSIKRELLEEDEIRRETQREQGQTPAGPPVLPSSPPVLPSEPPALIRQVATLPSTPEPIAEPLAETIAEPIAKPVLQFLEEPDAEDNMSLASNEINHIEQELKESLEKLSLAKMKKTLSRSKPKII
jgi:hypothetical protein